MKTTTILLAGALMLVTCTALLTGEASAMDCYGKETTDSYGAGSSCVGASPGCIGVAYADANGNTYSCRL